MVEGLKWTKNEIAPSDDRYLSLMSEENVNTANAFHRSFPQYKSTPLYQLNELSKYLGVRNIFCKDESWRFGLNAFKVLGGAYAMAKYIAKETGHDISEVNYDYLTSQKLRDEFGQATFFTATDGNHGRGVAWAAKRLHQKAVIRMPKGTTRTRFENIAKEDAIVTIEEGNYDDCVRMAAEEAARTEHGIVIQDTAWEGYEEIPSWIMQGYGTIVLEADMQLRLAGIDRPTHVFVQAGVGSLAGAVIGYFANRFKDDPPVMVVVEPNGADCLYQSAMRKDGSLISLKGDLKTIMAGLCCGTGNTVSWDILRNHADAFISCPDWISAKGTRIYDCPLSGDPRIVSGESGAVTLGIAFTILKDESLGDLKEALKLDENSNILVISSEGDTDPVRFREIIWDGLYGLEESRSI